MAESKGNKSKKTLDAFSDDLDSMLNLDDGLEQRVGTIEDDDAIDRLLVDDTFQDEQDDDAQAQLSDIDKLIAEEAPMNSKMTAEFDEFGDDIDDIIADIQINPKSGAVQVDENIAEFNAEDLADDDFPADVLENSALEIDEFADDTPIVPDITPEPINAVDADLDKMTEIDEFSDAPEALNNDSADFLLADFDISADEIDHMRSASAAAVEIAVEPEISIDEFADEEQQAVIETPPVEAVEPEPVAQVIEAVPLASVVSSVSEPEKSAPLIDYSAQIAGLSAQLNELKKQQKLVKQDIQIKADKDTVTGCLETIDSLQTEQKKAKRALDAFVSKKPVGVYVANGVAALAIVMTAALALEAYITKSQLNELVEIIGKLQQQVVNAPAVDAADKELLRKQLEELTVAQSVASNQISELTKAVHGDDAAKPAGDLIKQLSDLNNQDMQMGANIEALQNKVAALEKGKVVSAVAPAKPAAKKPVVVEQNWVVNLVAFKQDWYAKRKAEEFAGKGVPAKVSKTEAKGEKWYRLSVDGFKSQYEAAAYAAKVKKTLNLDSVWVAKNKD